MAVFFSRGGKKVDKRWGCSILNGGDSEARKSSTAAAAVAAGRASGRLGWRASGQRRADRKWPITDDKHRQTNAKISVHFFLLKSVTRASCALSVWSPLNELSQLKLSLTRLWCVRLTWIVQSVGLSGQLFPSVMWPTGTHWDAQD